MTETKKKTLTLGIDLGTTMSCMARAKDDGSVEIIDNRDGEHLTPSVVCYDGEGGAPVVGGNAEIKAQSTPENFVYEAKRMIGKGFEHPDVKKAAQHWSFTIEQIKGKGGGSSKDAIDDIGIVVYENGRKKVYEPVQVSATILSYLLECAKERLGDYPREVVVTVPAYFNNSSKERTLSAAKIAFSNKVDAHGNKVEINTTLLAEPIAAAVAYGSVVIREKSLPDGHEDRVMVFDLGGGTYDVSVLDFTFDRAGPVGIVKATDGDSFLGGADFDNVIIRMAREEAKRRNLVHNFEGMTPEKRRREEKKIELRLKRAAVQLKIQLSTAVQGTFNVNCYCGTEDLSFKVSRTQFERASESILNKLFECCKGLLLSCDGITPLYKDGYFDYQQTIEKYSADNPHNPRLTVADIDRHIQESKDKIAKVIMVGGSSRIPIVQSRLKEFFERKGEATSRVISPINPDQAVAYGAAYYAHSVAGGTSYAEGGPGLLLIDQVPLNLNIETLGGVATPVIKARTAIPCSQSQIFSTAVDNQEQVDIVVTQGNRAKSADNHTIGRFQLSNIQRAPRGIPQIEVTFSVDVNNVLTVEACDKATGSKQKVTVTNMSSNLSSDDIERMKKVAEEHEKADREFRECTEQKNGFESEIYMFRDQVKKKTELSDDLRKQVEQRCDQEEAWLREGQDKLTLAEVTERRQKFSTEIMQMLQSAAGGAAPTDNPDVQEVN